MSQNPLEEMS